MGRCQPMSSMLCLQLQLHDYGTEIMTNADIHMCSLTHLSFYIPPHTQKEDGVHVAPPFHLSHLNVLLNLPNSSQLTTGCDNS